MPTRQTDAAPLWWIMRRAQATPDYILGSANIRSPPVDVFALAQALGIELTFEDIEGPGIAQVTQEGARIRLRAKDSRVRQRFTAAHEIGHLMMHPLGQKYRDKAFDETHLEVQANGFAADLLMPFWMLDPYVMSHTRDHKVLAKIFEVSELSMQWRLRNWAGRP